MPIFLLRQQFRQQRAEYAMPPDPLLRPQPLTSTQRFLVEHPFCCFCGGKTPATTRDHVPAKCLFDNKHRPDRLVFPSCDQCQKLSKIHELVAGFVARIFPDAKTRAGRREIEKYGRRVHRAVPGLLEEMQDTDPEQKAKLAEIRRVEPRAAGMLSFHGPRVNASMEQFAVKLTCALYYEHTGRIVGEGEAVSVRIFTNVDAVEDNLPKELLRVLGQPLTLRQGKWAVPHQFFYQYVMTDQQLPAAFFSAFRESFAALGIVWGSPINLPDGEGIPTYVPVSG
jgi:hypothetical protein